MYNLIIFYLVHCLFEQERLDIVLIIFLFILEMHE